MNTRLQVEHPVTELITGIDLAQAQPGSPPRGASRDGQAELRGHAIEFRINAEDPARDFLPARTVTRFRPPLGPGVRVDTHVVDGYAILPFNRLAHRQAGRGRRTAPRCDHAGRGGR